MAQQYQTGYPSDEYRDGHGRPWAGNVTNNKRPGGDRFYPQEMEGRYYTLRRDPRFMDCKPEAFPAQLWQALSDKPISLIVAGSGERGATQPFHMTFLVFRDPVSYDQAKNLVGRHTPGKLSPVRCGAERGSKFDKAMFQGLLTHCLANQVQSVGPADGSGNPNMTVFPTQYNVAVNRPLSPEFVAVADACAAVIKKERSPSRASSGLDVSHKAGKKSSASSS